MRRKEADGRTTAVELEVVAKALTGAPHAVRNIATSNEESMIIFNLIMNFDDDDDGTALPFLLHKNIQHNIQIRSFRKLIPT